jgi:hypothetical protein
VRARAIQIITPPLVFLSYHRVRGFPLHQRILQKEASVQVLTVFEP